MHRLSAPRSVKLTHGDSDFRIHVLVQLSCEGKEIPMTDMPDNDNELFELPVPVCPVRGSVLFPTMVMPIDAGRSISISAINRALETDRTIVIVSQRDRDVEEPTSEDLYTVGTACTIMRMKKNPDGTVQMLVRAFARVNVEQWYESGGLIEADVTPLEIPDGDTVLTEAAFRELKEKFTEIVESGRNIPPEVAT